MKRNIIIRMLCLLLCVSMLLPPEAAATLLEEISVQGEGYDGLTTNEMAYVDQFYKGSKTSSPAPASYLNDDGMALWRWISNEKLNGEDRTDSGYLMLDEEVMRRSGKTYMGNGQYEKNSEANWHMFKEFNFRFIGPVADYFASGGASLGIALIEEGAFATKFKWAGKSAYPYYLQLQQVFYEYMTDLQNELQKVDDTFDYLAKGITSISDIGMESLKGTSETISSENAGKTVRVTTEKNILMLYGEGKGPALNHRATRVDFESKILYVKKTGTTGVVTQKVPFWQLDKNAKLKNSFINYDLSGLKEEIRNRLLVEELKINVEPDGVGMGKLGGLDYKYVQKVVENANEIPDLKENELKGIEKATTFAPSKKIDLYKDMKTVKDIAQKANVINNTIQAFNSTVNVSAQQSCYMNVLTNMSQHYLDMLSQWYQDVETYEVPSGFGDVQRDIKYAILAITKDVLDLQAEATQELKDAAAKNKGWGMAFVYNMGKYAETILDIAEAAGWKGIKKITEWVTNHTTNISGNTKITSITSGAAAITSLAINVFTAKFLEFEDKASTIYNLKWSLDELLRNKEDGLLVQYAENRTHDNACKIIEALNTMRQLKLMGENLVEEYYLCDFYDSLGVNTSSAAHLVLRNEMAKRTSDEKLDASGSFTPIIGVYKYFQYDYPTLVVTMLGGDFHGQSDYVLVDYYLKNASDQAIYNGKMLAKLPLAYGGITNEKPSAPWTYYVNTYQDYNVYMASNYNTAYEIEEEKLYKDDKMMLYSANGLEVPLTSDDYDQYMKLEMEINRLIDTYGDNSTIDWRQWEQEEHSRKEEKKVEKEKDLQERLQWTITTRGWIEAIDMYDPSTDYIELKKTGYYGGYHPTTIYIKP